MQDIIGMIVLILAVITPIVILNFRINKLK